VTGWLDPGSVADTGAYLVRLLRLDPTALVRLRPAVVAPDADGARDAADATPAGAGTGGAPIGLWARLPFGVLVTRQVRGPLAEDATVRAAELLARLTDPAGSGSDLPVRRDADWRWPLPSGPGTVVERLPAGEIQRLGAAAETTLREAVAGGVRGRAVGERMLRDALLDHVSVVVTTDAGARVEVPQRLVQAVVRMGFLGTPGATPPDVAVRVAGDWVALACAYGSAWYRRSISLHMLRPG
jgi:hypothetical protein